MVKSILLYKKGMSTLELVITLTIISIVSGIAFINMQNTFIESEKRTLYTQAETFASFLGSCIKLSGGWKLFKNGVSYYPCKANNTTDLKKMLNFECPKDATCDTHTHYRGEEGPGWTVKDHYKYNCLNMQKEKSGQKLQVLTIVHFERPQSYEIWCGEVDNYAPFNQKVCRRNANHVDLNTGLTKDCPGWH